MSHGPCETWVTNTGETVEVCWTTGEHLVHTLSLGILIVATVAVLALIHVRWDG